MEVPRASPALADVHRSLALGDGAVQYLPAGHELTVEQQAHVVPHAALGRLVDTLDHGRHMGPHAGPTLTTDHRSRPSLAVMQVHIQAVSPGGAPEEELLVLEQDHVMRVGLGVDGTCVGETHRGEECKALGANVQPLGTRHLDAARGAIQLQHGGGAFTRKRHGLRRPADLPGVVGPGEVWHDPVGCDLVEAVVDDRSIGGECSVVEGPQGQHCKGSHRPVHGIISMAQPSDAAPIVDPWAHGLRPGRDDLEWAELAPSEGRGRRLTPTTQWLTLGIVVVVHSTMMDSGVRHSPTGRRRVCPEGWPDCASARSAGTHPAR